MVPIEEPRHIVRLALIDGHSVPFQLHATPADDQYLRDLRNLMRADVASRALLFGQAAIFVEGETELGTLPIWLNLEAQDTVLYSVGGKGNFVSPLKLAQRFNIPYVILCDGDAIWDLHQKGERGTSHGPDTHIRAICNARHLESPIAVGDPGTVPDDFQRWRDALEQLGIFTLARSARSAFDSEMRSELPSELVEEATLRFGTNKVGSGRYLAEHHYCPAETASVLKRMLQHLHAQGADITTQVGESGR
jgi:OLD-like protein